MVASCTASSSHRVARLLCGRSMRLSLRAKISQHSASAAAKPRGYTQTEAAPSGRASEAAVCPTLKQRCWAAPADAAANSARLSWSFDKVDQNLKSIMVNIYTNMSAAAEEYGQKDNFVVGANIAGFLKVADAMLAQGVI